MTSHRRADDNFLLALEHGSTGQAARLLATTLWHVTLLARGSYLEAGVDAAASVRALRACNEITHQLSQQIRAYLSNPTARAVDVSAYAPSVLVQALRDRARNGGFEAEIEALLAAAALDYSR